MKAKLTAFSIILLLSAFCCSADEPIIDFGTIDGSIYSHNYFGMKITIPEKWQVQDLEARERLMKLGKDVVSGDDQNMKAIMNASELNTLNLLTMFRHPLGAAVDFNPSFVCVAEKVSQLPGIQKGSDYLFHSRKLLEMSQLKYTFVGSNSSETISGVPFDIMGTELNLNKVVVKQNFYATIRKGYALCFVLSYDTDQAKKQLHDIVDSVQFTPSN